VEDATELALQGQTTPEVISSNRAMCTEWAQAEWWWCHACIEKLLTAIRTHCTSRHRQILEIIFMYRDLYEAGCFCPAALFNNCTANPFA